MEGVLSDLAALEQLHAKQKELFDTINNLLKHGVNHFIDSPKIIIVGDQSSGKSSVLQAISRVRFPIKDEQCTRFATELVLRTDRRIKVEVTIQLAPSSSKRQARLFTKIDFDKPDIPTIIEDAKRKMLVDDTGFSEDILRIEIHGPDLPHLTLVDLPGFHSEVENMFAPGQQIINRLTHRYMCQGSNIILAVISATNQAGLQRVLAKVKEHDRNTERTFGIITKPDMVAPGSEEEESFLRLAKNIDIPHKLSLGWHVLRNRTEVEQDQTDQQRDDTEREFFNSKPWSSIPSENRGVDKLRAKLGKTLLQHITKDLPALMQSIEAKLNERKKQLKLLGPARQTPNEIRSYLGHIASQLERLSRDALDGNYTDEFFGELYHESNGSSINSSRIRKLRALIKDLNRSFVHVLRTRGASYSIRPRDTDGSGDNRDGTRVSGTSNLPQFLQVLVDQYKFDTPREVSFESITADLERLSSENKGYEFSGGTNDRFVRQLFQDQMRPWEGIAKFHLKLVLDTCKAFIESLVEHIAGPDCPTLSALLTNTIYPFFDKKELQLEEKLQELLHHYKKGYPQPLYDDFQALVSNRGKAKLSDHALRYLLATRPDLFTDAAKAELNNQHLSRSSPIGIQHLIYKSETYYDMSIRIFMDNVVVLAAENCVLADLPKIFTTGSVNQMSDAELERLGSEFPDVQQERAELQAECDSLNEGLQSCQKYRDRPKTSLPFMFDRLSLGAPPVPSAAVNSPFRALPISGASPSSVQTTEAHRQPLYSGFGSTGTISRPHILPQSAQSGFPTPAAAGGVFLRDLPPNDTGNGGGSNMNSTSLQNNPVGPFAMQNPTSAVASGSSGGITGNAGQMFRPQNSTPMFGGGTSTNRALGTQANESPPSAVLGGGQPSSGFGQARQPGAFGSIQTTNFGAQHGGVFEHPQSAASGNTNDIKKFQNPYVLGSVTYTLPSRDNFFQTQPPPTQFPTHIESYQNVCFRYPFNQFSQEELRLGATTNGY